MLDEAIESSDGDFQPFPQNQCLQISTQYSPTPKEMVIMKKNFL